MRIGLIGTGTVGGGVIQILESKIPLYREKLGLDLELACICARTEEELAPFKSKGYKTSVDAMAMIADPSIDVLVELAGGYDMPRKWITAALEHKKHVVTANKAMLAKYGHELFPLAEKNGCHILFEAAVGGGIPIIRSIQEGFVGNEVEHLSCIINGTCNYILSRMGESGLSFDAALKEAQEKGYAERNPTFDIEGTDSAHKTALLASLCSGKYVDFEKIHVTGVSHITAEDIVNAKELGYKIKLLGIYAKGPDGSVDARVHPSFVPNEHLLANVDGVLNAVYLQCDNLGPTLQTGAGAGRLPTASAVVADLVSLARSTDTGKRKAIPMGWFNKENAAKLVPIEDTYSRYYLRFTTRDACGVLASITGIFSENGISIESIIQKGVNDPGKVSIIVVSERTKESKILSALNSIDALSSVAEKSQMIRFLK
ncbi:MAG: homoserine dehydrogenase [Fibrobacteraceae bacterium]|nr:homoserine dehydrogenase [Fibrobacteraceae bacterium]